MSELSSDGKVEMGGMGAAAAGAKAINAVSKNGLVNALFLPTAKAYGDHWGQQTRERLAEAAKAKKQENLRDHLGAVRSAVDSSFKPDPQLAQDWCDGAENVDPVDKDLSAAWRGVLLAIGAGEVHRQDLLKVVRGLTPAEAAEFMAIADWARRGGWMTARYFEHRRRLEDLGLIRRPFDVLLLGPGLVSGMIALLIIGAVLVADRLPGPTQRSLELYGATMSMVALMMGGVAILYSITVIARPRLTKLGEALLGVAQRAAALPTEPPEASTPKEPAKTKPRARGKRKSSQLNSSDQRPENS